MPRSKQALLIRTAADHQLKIIYPDELIITHTLNIHQKCDPRLPQPIYSHDHEHSYQQHPQSTDISTPNYHLNLVNLPLDIWLIFTSFLQPASVCAMAECRYGTFIYNRNIHRYR